MILDLKIVKQRKAFSLQFKLRLVEEAKRTNNRIVGKIHGIDESVVRKWRKDEEKIIEASLSVSGDRFRMDGGGRKRDDLLDQILYEWYSTQVSCNVKVTGPMLRTKAEELSSACSTSSEGYKVRNIWVFSPLNPSNREKNIIVNLIIPKLKSKHTSLKKYTN